MVLIINEICATDTPNTAGPINFNMRFTPSSSLPSGLFSSNLGNKPICLRKGIWNSNCKKPPKNTAQAKALIGSAKRSAKNKTEPIMATLSQTGVNAGMPNLL